MAVYLPPSSRLTDWTPGTRTGVVGGIAQYRPGGASQRITLIDVTAAPYNADDTGATNAAAAIQSAINAATSGQVVWIPAGDYLCTTSISVGTKKNITVRGAGIGATRLILQGNAKIGIGSESDYTWTYPSTNNTVTAGLAKDSTVLTMANTSAFAVGQMIHIKFENQTNNTAIESGLEPVVSVAGYPNMRRQKSRVTAKTATTLTIFPPIIHAPAAGLAATVHVAQLWSENVGLEDFEIDCTGCTNAFPVYLSQCYNCWLYRIKSTNCINYHVFLVDTLQCEVRQCWLDGRQGSGTNGAALLWNCNTAGLVTESVLARVFPCLEVNHGSCGNAFLYNVLERASGQGGGMMNVNHGPHNSHNLYEGDLTPNFQADGYFGSSSDDTFFRNWFHGAILGFGNFTFTTSLNRFTRNYSLLGNITGASGYKDGAYSYGNPNLGNSSFTGTAQPTLGDFWADWAMTATLTTRTSDTAGVITLASGSLATAQLFHLTWGTTSRLIVNLGGTVAGSVVTFSGGSGTALPAQGSTVNVFPGPSGFQESDLDVEASTIMKGNYKCLAAGGGSIPAGESLGADTLPLSLAYGDTPPADWPSGFPFPPIDATDPAASQDWERTAAGSWFVNGVWPSDTPTAPVITVDPVSQTVAEGATVVLTANASGAPTPTWSWTKDGAPISGATSRTLTLTAVTTANAGSYVATASNSEGSDPSATAVLTVTAGMEDGGRPYAPTDFVYVP